MKRFIIAMLFCCAAFPAFAGLKEGDEAMEKEDYKTALKEFTALANKGDAQAQFNLAAIYNQGLGVDENLAKAFTLFLKAAEQNHARAQFIVGQMYSIGRGVTANEQESIKWLQKSATQGFAQAQNELGNRLYDKKDFKESLIWYRKAAEQNNANAQYNVGYQYQQGEGVEANSNEAMQWYLKAANQGSLAGQEGLADLYVSQKNYAEAVKWTMKLAEAGDINRIRMLGLHYEKGIGVDQNLIKAYQFYVVASDMGHDKQSSDLKAKLAERLSEHDKKEGATGAMRWMLVGPGQLRELH
jgi:hypothetical protein